MADGEGLQQQDAAWLTSELVDAAVVPLDRHAVRELTRLLTRSDLAPGTVLYKKNSVPRGVWIVRTGRVELYDGTGEDRQVIGVLRPGDFVGDLYIILGLEAPLNARTLDHCVCLFLDADSFRELLTRHPSLAVAWLSSFAHRLAGSRTRVFETLGRTLPERVARLLIEQPVDGHLRLPQSTIAQMLGARRSSINRVLKEFESRALIEIGYREIVVKDRKALLLLARGSS